MGIIGKMVREHLLDINGLECLERTKMTLELGKWLLVTAKGEIERTKGRVDQLLGSI